MPLWTLYVKWQMDLGRRQSSKFREKVTSGQDLEALYDLFIDAFIGLVTLINY